LNYVKAFNNPDSTIAFAVGNSGTALRSSDRGHTWVNRSVPSSTKDFYGFDFIEYFPNVGVHIVVVGDSGTVMKSTSSGGNWTWLARNAPTTRRLKSVGVITSDIIVVVGERGTIYRTSNGGTTWQNRTVPDTLAHFNRLLISRFFPNFNRAWAVGDNGRIYATTDYGNSWFRQTSGTTKHLRDLVFQNSDTGAVAGDDGTVRNTTNGGSTWLADPFLNGLTTRDILSLAKVDSNTVNSVTTNLSTTGAVVDTTYFLAVSSEPLTGIQPIDNFIQTTFSLHQNYPNPFNPTTTIRFSVRSPSDRVPASPAGGQGSAYGSVGRLTTLKVFDLRGKEVTTLVSENLPAGEHVRTFEGAGLSSGVYFYQLRVGAYSKTKKMILTR
jgi:photosystem II stability/assembly factor-like uncharacterized protein